MSNDDLTQDDARSIVENDPEFAKLVADDTEKWAKVIRRANIKPE